LNDSDLKKRKYDIIVYGATGFTGKLVAEYLLKTYGVNGSIRWAIAGRDEKKLELIRRNLKLDKNDLDIFIASSFDIDSLKSMVLKTNVILSTVGPYAIYGDFLVAACVENGTHYCDLAGEVQWIRKIIDLHQEEARKTGSKIVHCCGFDSVPMDIGVWFLQKEVYQKTGEYCQSISMVVKKLKGSASGGTIASLINIIKESRKNKNTKHILNNPYSLNPSGERKGLENPEESNIIFHQEINSWTAPFIMAGINTKVVRRSHALTGYTYGDNFSYDESIATGSGFIGWLKGKLINLFLILLISLLAFSTTRIILEKFILKKPGEGPDRESQRNGFFHLIQVGKLSNGDIFKSEVIGDRDPGYGSTAKMISECAVCLSVENLDEKGGVWTPASIMAKPLLKRLQDNAGLVFKMNNDNSS
tara:strand:+ start:649 stop:1902 length:1254 start_codon:yes stop_codon:yes gene_type:complete